MLRFCRIRFQRIIAQLPYQHKFNEGAVFHVNKAVNSLANKENQGMRRRGQNTKDKVQFINEERKRWGEYQVKSELKYKGRQKG